MTSTRDGTVRTGDDLARSTRQRLYKNSATVEASPARTKAGESRDGEGWAATVASLLVGAGFFALWFWLAPPLLGFQVEAAGAARWRGIAAVPAGLGFAVALRCVWDFGPTGHAKAAP